MSTLRGDRLRIVRSEVVRSLPGFEETVAATGIDPRTLFGGKPAGTHDCDWVGHQVYGFQGLGGEGARIGSPHHP